jgi:ribosomal protein S5
MTGAPKSNSNTTQRGEELRFRIAVVTGNKDMI